jgi:uncharacterized damage-inducible protein DinB
VELREFLLEPIGYLAPAKALDGLTVADAERRVKRLPHSIAEIVAHLAFWQDWFLARCSGQAIGMVASAADGWPAVAAGSWPTLRSRFLQHLDQLSGLAHGDATKPITPPIEFPPLASYTIADVLVHVATHNAHHIGQVIVIRQLTGTWPPPAGSWTW